MGLGRRLKSRLKSRFVAHNKEMNRWLGAFAICFPASFVALACLGNLGVPEWLLKCLAMGICVITVLAFHSTYYYLSLRVGAKYKLLCANCGSPLPDSRIDGEVPRRCPHCYVDVADATGQKSSKQKQKAVEKPIPPKPIDSRLRKKLNQRNRKDVG